MVFFWGWLQKPLRKIDAKNWQWVNPAVIQVVKLEVCKGHHGTSFRTSDKTPPPAGDSIIFGWWWKSHPIYVGTYTPQKTNMSPENQWLEDVFPTKIVHFFGTFLSFQGCNLRAMSFYMSAEDAMFTFFRCFTGDCTWVAAVEIRWKKTIQPGYRGHEYTILGGGFKDFFIFTPKIGEEEPILTHIMFSIGFVQPPTT